MSLGWLGTEYEQVTVVFVVLASDTVAPQPPAAAVYNKPVWAKLEKEWDCECVVSVDAESASSKLHGECAGHMMEVTEDMEV